jgi:hypothetical protein
VGTDVDVLDFVGDGVAVFEADGADVDAAFGGLIVSEVLDHAEDIWVDVVGGASVEDDVVAGFEAGEGGGEGGAVEESDLVSEFDACDWAAGVGFADDVEAEAEVLVEDEGGGDEEADDDASEEVGEDDGGDGEGEGEELGPAGAEHGAEDGWFG